MVGTEMSDQDRVIHFDWGALLLETEVGIQVINNPGAVNGHILSRERGLLLVSDWRIDSRSEGLAGEVQGLAMEVRVDLNPDLLTVANDLVAPKDIALLDLLDNEYGSGDGTWVS